MKIISSGNATGFRTAGERTLVKEAKKRGWTVLGRNAKNLIVLQHSSGIIRNIGSNMDNGFTKKALRDLDRALSSGPPL
jgi:hypothetical protein